MSYPDLGCYAECLTCELCAEQPEPPEPPDLFPDNLLDDGDGFLDLDLTPPEPDTGPDEWWDDWNLPSGGADVGGIEITPTWDPWGIEIKGTFD